jgi:hypothetical protein
MKHVITRRSNWILPFNIQTHLPRLFSVASRLRDAQHTFLSEASAYCQFATVVSPEAISKLSWAPQWIRFKRIDAL